MDPDPTRQDAGHVPASASESGSAAPAPPLAAAGPPKLRRRRQGGGKVLAGVAGGIADFFRVDPVLVRVLLVALTAAGGTGLVLYLLLWATIPAADAEESAAEALLRRVRAAPPWLQAVLAGFAFVLVVQGFVGDGVGVFTGVVLVAIGIALFGRGTAQAAEPTGGAGGGEPDGGPAPAVASPASAYQPAPYRAMGATALGWSGTDPVAPPPSWAPPVPRPVRPPSILGRLTLAVGLLVLGLVAVLDRVGAVELTAERLLALALTIVGAGLLVGAWRGRARGLLVLGVLLLPPLLAVNLLGDLARGGIGDGAVRPTGLTDLRPEYRWLVGSSVLDLSRVDFAETPTVLAASVAVGELTVIVPRDVSVTARGDVGAGALDLFGPWTEGSGLSREVADRGEEGGGRLVLDVEAGFGAVTVRRAGTTGGS